MPKLMPKLSDEIKNEIIKQYRENIPVNDIICNLKIGRATYYKIIKEFKQEEKSVINTTLQSIENSTEKSTQTPNLNTSSDEAIESNQDEVEKVEQTVFDINEFKRELNEVEDNHYAEQPDDIKEEEIHISTAKELVSLPEVLKPNRRTLPLPLGGLEKKSKEFFPLPTEKSVLSNISFAKRKGANNTIDKSNILDTIKNVNSGGSIEELKEKRSVIIIIRQYCNTFPEQLKNIIGIKKSDFDKKLFNMNIDQLNLILENIRVEMNLNRNAELFNTGVSVGLKGLETISKYSGYDVEGLEKELMNDRDFLLDLQIIQAEIDMSKYINPKSSAFLKVVRRMYMLNQQNEVKKQLDNVLNDPNKLNEIKNLK